MSGSRSKARTIVPLGIGVVLLLVVGVVAVMALTGSDGGSDSPEAAVELMVDGIAAEDPLAVVAAMNPDEVRLLGDLVAVSQDKAAELGFVEGDDPYAGTDLEVVDLELSTEELADGVVMVTIDDLRVDWEVDPAASSDRVEEVVDATGEEGPERESGRFDEGDLVAEDEDGDEIDPFVVAVETGGGWYVSPMYTAAQYIAEATGTEPDFGAVDDQVDEPADSPTAAVEQLAVAVGNLDVDGALAVLPGDELAPLRAYRSVIERELEDAIDEGELDEISFELSDVETSEVELDGGATKVLVEGFEGEYRYVSDDEELEGSFEWDGRCLAAETTEDGDTEESESCVEPDEMAVFGLDQFFVVTVEERGGHVVSPVATLLEYWRTVVESLDESVVLAAFGAPQLIEPGATLAPGDTAEVAFTPAGIAVVELELEEGTDYVFSYDEPEDEYWYWDLYRDGEYVTYGSTGGVFAVDESGTYRAVLTAERLGGGATEVGLQAVEAEEVELPAELSGSLDPGEIAAFEFEVDGDEDGDLRVDVAELSTDDYGALLLVDPDGYSTGFYDGENEAVSLVDGTWRLVVNGGTDGLDYEVSLALTPPEGFEGGADSEIVEVAPGAPVTVPVTLSEGSDVEISAYPDGVANIRLVLFDPGATPIVETDDVSSGSESLVLDDVPADGTYLLEVSTLDEADTVELELYSY